MTPKRYWPCEHISQAPNGNFIYLGVGGDGFSYHTLKGDSWNLCPICGAQRPKKRSRKK